MPNLKVEMRLLNARHVAFSGSGVADPIFSEPTFTVEHERRLESAAISTPAEYATDQRAYDCGKIRDAADKDSFDQPILPICITRHSTVA
jgi:hypothetical protein